MRPGRLGSRRLRSLPCANVCTGIDNGASGGSAGGSAGGTVGWSAALVGVSRMYHDQHWASDVVAGAAIGTFSGLKVVQYAYRNPRNRLDRWLLPLTLEPTSEGGVQVAWRLPTR